MDPAYDPAAWHDLYVFVGGAAAVLTGLIFVAVSLHLRPVVADRWLRGRAESSLLALMTVVLISGAVLVPGQETWALGAEIALVVLLNHLHGIRGLVHLPASRRPASVAELLVGIAGSLLGLLAGISLIVHWGGGLWLLLPGGALALVSSVWNAWRLMVDVAEEAGAANP
jgi:hypothetical protein